MRSGYNGLSAYLFVCLDVTALKIWKISRPMGGYPYRTAFAVFDGVNVGATISRPYTECGR